MTNRLSPLDPPYAADVEGLLARYPQQNGYLLTLFRTFANSARFLGRGVANLLDRDSPLALRDREIVILRVTGHFACAYEWGVHVAIFASGAKFTPAQIAATWHGGGAAAEWTRREHCLIEAVDSFCARGTLSDDALETFSADWSKPQQLEIIALCGAYHTISLVANAARLPPEPFAAPIPPA
jgi:alkylhydroperoxidase family enzyme